MHIEVDDSRRLTGINLLSNHAGAIIDLKVKNCDENLLISTWEKIISELLVAVNWEKEKYFSRIFSGGISLSISAPIDTLYAATEVNEYAIELCQKALETKHWEFNPQKIEDLKKTIKEESKPSLLHLKAAAEKRGISFLSDDDEVSLGLGKGSQTWSLSECPKVDEVNWDELYDIPVFMVTGTNGKSTTVRLTAAIFKEAGKSVGTSSTDFLKVGETIIDRGDYSGPGGARSILRHPDVDVAILEVARGGILRRGLALDKIDAALVTNVAADHLGQYGIDRVEELAECKFVLAKAIKEEGYLVVNADNERSLAESKNYPVKKIITSFSEFENNGSSLFLEDGYICYKNNGKREEILSVKDAAITLNGAAKHNIRNLMSAIALAKIYGIDTACIERALRNFKNDASDNPGRANLFQIKSADILVDFAHNEHGMNAIIETAKNFQSKRKLISVGHAGDRSDEDIKTLAQSALKMNPDAIIITEVPEYLRGRKKGEIPKLFHQFFKELNFAEEKLLFAKDSFDMLRIAMNWLKAGDFLLLLLLNHREEILDKLTRLSNK